MEAFSAFDAYVLYGLVGFGVLLKSLPWAFSQFAAAICAYRRVMAEYRRAEAALDSGITPHALTAR